MNPWNPSRGCRMATLLFVALASGAVRSTAPEERLARELVRERIEAFGHGTDAHVEGARIAATALLADVYERRDFRLEWIAPEKISQLLQAIRESEDDGLDPEDYHLSALDDLVRRVAGSADPSLASLVDRDLLLTDALARLGYHLLFGKVDYHVYDPVWNFGRKIHDLEPAVALQRVIDAPDIRAALEREKPAYPAYAGLKAQYARYRAIRGGGGWKPVPRGETLRPGDQGPRVRALRERLAVTDDLPAASADDERFDDGLAEAVRGFQRRHGLEADGVVGSGTLDALNVPVEARVDQIRLNLERARWLLHDMPERFVIVNVAGFRLHVVDGGRIDWITRVQVGKPYRRTPVFRSRITYLVLNPTWTVPSGILSKDILPAQRRDPGTLARKELKVIDREGAEVDPATIDWSSASGRSFPYTLRQDPGPRNALGRVKFMFPNEHAVYLHDTPSVDLFERAERAFSSGCIRVEDPLRLAELLLEGQPGWTRAEIDAAVATGKTRSVTLAEPVPVLLSYWTAWTEKGKVQFRRDLYSRDAKVLEGLDAEFEFRRAPRKSRATR
jgi:murein L,D-transpeptidase YcbB/YkuD